MDYIRKVLKLSTEKASPYKKTELPELGQQQLLAECKDGQLVWVARKTGTQKPNEGRKSTGFVADIILLDKNGRAVWDNPFTVDGHPNKAYVSGDRILLTTFASSYGRWGMLGPAFMLDMHKGAAIVTLKGESGAALKNGRFILGLEGYDYFNTWLIGTDGDILQEWRSYGHYVIDENDDVRVLEKDRRVPTKSRVVRLTLDGGIERGPLLSESQISSPLILQDWALFFVDAGVIRIVDRELNEQFTQTLIPIPHEDSRRFDIRYQFAGDNIAVDIYERPDIMSKDYQQHRWMIELN